MLYSLMLRKIKVFAHFVFENCTFRFYDYTHCFEKKYNYANKLRRNYYICMVKQTHVNYAGK